MQLLRMTFDSTGHLNKSGDRQGMVSCHMGLVFCFLYETDSYFRKPPSQSE